ncbi:YggS family pyridoxal phosphate-dependent enzyme [Lachnoclostridium edouardi]|uniref:YggS family pyridoxal phosphate-dependent enzyme n=1 Tax=Lachnoclostridium edouardi TaxID=1926283 RepID=UPI000C7E75E3|nr:YggS family pyridoxal phosphate-dependent enzyme [Lachnoclostridium edouardi]MDO4278619.1 YggS family pyridoxal phosphate-dependent enzyme [Lachnoclostridium edouardi]
MIRENIREVEKNIAAACKRAGRNPEDVLLIAVSKTKPVSMILEAIDAGMTDFGENRVQEIVEKIPQVPSHTRFHMIGHLQKNKVRQVIDKAVLIHSVDSVALAEQISKEAVKRNIQAEILLEVNVAREESKFGFYLEDLEENVKKIQEFSNIIIKGFMTVAPFVENPEDNREIFKKLYQFYVDMKSKNIDNGTMSVLSMGMTGDYEVAIEEGATMIRVGTGIFGTR